MKNASIVVGEHYQNNRLFDLTNKFLNRDDCLKPFVFLRSAFEERGYRLDTSDLLSSNDAEIVIYNEMPKQLSNIDKEKSYLLIFESELIRPDNWKQENHKRFKKVFTWNDDFVDNETYFKMNFTSTFKYTKPDLKNRTRFACLISGNKTSNHPKELYSKRLETIRWFEKNQKDKFDYYGIGWDKYNFGSQKISKIINKLGLYSILPKRKTPCYKGLVDNKHDVLKTYKFNICYENAKDINGYITEKIFDALFAGCIPVYWGPKNITDFVDSSCFIDRRNFKTDKEMFEYLINYSDDKLLTTQENILNYLKSDKAKNFSAEYFGENIVKNILNE